MRKTKNNVIEIAKDDTQAGMLKNLLTTKMNDNTKGVKWCDEIGAVCE